MSSSKIALLASISTIISTGLALYGFFVQVPKAAQDTKELIATSINESLERNGFKPSLNPKTASRDDIVESVNQALSQPFSSKANDGETFRNTEVYYLNSNVPFAMFRIYPSTAETHINGVRTDFQKGIPLKLPQPLENCSGVLISTDTDDAYSEKGTARISFTCK